MIPEHEIFIYLFATDQIVNISTTFLVVSVVTKETDWMQIRVALVSQINAAAGKKNIAMLNWLVFLVHTKKLKTI